MLIIFYFILLVCHIKNTWIIVIADNYKPKSSQINYLPMNFYGSNFFLLFSQLPKLCYPYCFRIQVTALKVWFRTMYLSPCIHYVQTLEKYLKRKVIYDTR